MTESNKGSGDAMSEDKDAQSLVQLDSTPNINEEKEEGNSSLMAKSNAAIEAWPR